MSIKKEIRNIEKDINKAERNIKRDINKTEEGIERGINKTEKDIERDIKHAEKWMHERRKFFIKLGFVVVLVAVLLIVSHFFLRTGGVGI